MSATVCVLITSWNQVDKTMACLESVYGQDYVPFSVLLVDNASQDDTVVRVSTEFSQVEIIQAPRNLGFAAGYNLGLRQALKQEFDYVFLINNDTLLAPDCLTGLVEAAKSQPDTGMLTAKIYYASERQRIWSLGGLVHPLTLEVVGKVDDQIDVGEWEEPRPIDFAPLCGVLLSRRVLMEVGLLDEDFFLYYEDMDYCRRTRLQGFEIYLIPAARMWHVVSASSGGRNSPSERYWMAQSSGRYFRKHAQGGRMVVVFPYRLGSALKTTLTLVWHGHRRAALAYWQGLAIGWASGKSTKPPPKWVTHPDSG